MTNITFLIQDDLTANELTFAQIAEKYNVTAADVLDVFEDMVKQETEDYDDSIDGDFDSAMASAGFGTDEDYGYYGDEF